MAKDKHPIAKPDRHDPSIHVREFAGGEKPVRRTFPGPRDANARLRVAIERFAYAELVAHAKSSLAAEVCGVLAGHVCEDDEGVFVSVEAVIRGTDASQASTHVTFTQETWNAIHKTLERDFPKLKIVGWYHTHPGFGVEFSEMDLFIQRNFFSGRTQLALVTDPLKGDVAICINTAEGIQYVERFWVDGREQQCRVPARSTETSPDARAAEAATVSADKMQALESRVSQLVQSLDEVRTFHYRFMLMCGFVFCLAVMGTAGYLIYNQWRSRVEPPQLNQFVPIPVQVGDKVVLLGVAVTSWEVPPDLNALLLQEDMLKREAEKKAKPEAEKTNSAPASATNTVPPAGR